MKKLITGIIVSISALLMLGITGFAAEGVKIPFTDYVSGSTTQGLNTRKDAIKQYSGSAVGYKINTETSPTSVTLTIGTDATNAGIAELRLDSKGGRLLGTVDVSSKAFSWRGVDFSIPISEDISGEHTLWVCFKKGQHDFYGITLKVPDPNSAYYPFLDENLFTDIDDYGNKNELNLLAGLGILDSGDAFDPERLAVKRDLIKALAGFFRDTAGWETGAIYADITPEDPDYKAFSVLCSMGIIEKNPTKQFKPNERLTVDWACQMSCRVLSFGFPDTIKLNNMQIAKRLGLLDGISSGLDMRRKDMAKLLYNMLDAHYADVVGVVDTALKYDIKECILERTRNIYQGEGVVSANQSYNIYSNEEMAARDRVIIDSIMPAMNVQSDMPD